MDEAIEKAIGSRIATFREQRGLTQAELAERLGLAPETISRMERGISIPSIKTLANLGQTLKVELKEFFTEVPVVFKGKARKDQELAKVTVFLQNKEVADIRLSHRVLRSMFDGLKTDYRPIKK